MLRSCLGWKDKSRSDSLGGFFLALIWWLTGGGALSAERSVEPAGVCYPVNGSGYTFSSVDQVRVPIGALSPLAEGDSLVVLTGTIGFMDFRSGLNPVYGLGTRMTVPPGNHPRPPNWVGYLRDHIKKSLHGPELIRVSGAVRASDRIWCPDSARFAPGVNVTFEWAQVGPPPVLGRIVCAGDTTTFHPDVQHPEQGLHVWNPPAGTSGPATLELLNSKQQRVAGGRFELLTPAAASAARDEYRKAVPGDVPAEFIDLASGTIARANRDYLW